MSFTSQCPNCQKEFEAEEGIHRRNGQTDRRKVQEGLNLQRSRSNTRLDMWSRMNEPPSYVNLMLSREQILSIWPTKLYTEKITLFMPEICWCFTLFYGAKFKHNMEASNSTRFLSWLCSRNMNLDPKRMMHASWFIFRHQTRQLQLFHHFHRI